MRNTQVITFTLRLDEYRAMKVRAQTLGISQAQFIKQAIEREMKRTGKLAAKDIPIGAVGEMREDENNSA